MSKQIDTALVQSYHSNIEAGMIQQKNARLWPNVRQETQNSEYDYFDRIGATKAQRKTSRHGDTPLVETPHDRRRIGLNDYNWADLIDKSDRLRMLADPTSSYVMNAIMAMNRAKDDEIIAAATGPAFTGKNGETTVTFPGTQQIAVNFAYPAAGGNTNLTLDKLLKAKDMLGVKEAYEDGDELIAAISQSQMTSLLRTTEIKNVDYNSVKSLVNGEVDTFMGFKFIRLEALLKTGNIRSALFYVKNGILGSSGEDVMTQVTPRADKNYSTQVYVEMSIGATRMYEEKVIECLCDETT